MSRKQSEQINYREYITAIIVSILVWLFWETIIPQIDGTGSDGTRYIQMAMGEFYDVPSPFKYRILLPFIASLFHNPMSVFHIVTFLSEICAGFFLYLYLRKLKYSHLFSIIGIVLFYFSFNGAYYSWYPYLTDPLNLFFVILCFYFIILKNDFAYMIALLIGVLNRETLILTIIPFFFSRIMANNYKETFIHSITVSIPAIIALLIVHFPGVLPPTNTSIQHSYLSTISFYFNKAFVSGELFKSGIGPIFSNIFSSWGLLWILAVFGWYESPKFLKYSTIYALFLLAMVFWDAERMLIPLFPIIIPMALTALSNIKSHAQRKWLFPCILMFIFLAQFFWAFEGFPSRGIIVGLKNTGLLSVFLMVASEYGIGLKIFAFILSGIVFLIIQSLKKMELTAILIFLFAIAFSTRGNVERSMLSAYISSNTQVNIKDERSEEEIVLFVNEAISELAQQNVPPSKTNSGYYWEIYYGDAIVYVEIFKAEGVVFFVVHSPLAQTTNKSDVMIPLMTMLLEENDPLQTGPAKIFIRDGAFVLGSGRSIAYLQKEEAKHIINFVGITANDYNDMISDSFGCSKIAVAPQYSNQ